MLSPSPPPSSPEPRPALPRATRQAHPRALPRALSRRLLGGRRWRAALYLLTSVPLGVATLVALLLLAVVGSALTVLVIGVPLLLTLVLAGIPLAALERRRLRLIDPAPLLDPHREPPEPGLASWLRTRLQERCTWRELAYALLFAFVLWPLEALAVGSVLLVCGGLTGTPVMMAAGGDGEARVLKLWLADSWPEAFAVLLAGVVLLPLLTWPLGVVARGRAVLTRALLSPPDSALDSRIAELDRSRTRLVDAFEAERRRIERDLHDGAQQRLVALSMTLGLARLERPAEPLGGLLDRAHEEASVALVEIRELIHGIHPHILTDRGLGAAVEDLADRSPVPVEVRFAVPARLPEAVETAVYFAVSEALTNVAKHSGASRVTVTGATVRKWLTVEVEDDGRGGARLGGTADAEDDGRRGGGGSRSGSRSGSSSGSGSRGGSRGGSRSGTGLQGVADRLSVLGGTLLLSSPPGGPTVFRLEVPCPPADSRT
ncbi:sensor histidine kinase [Streptomyces sp. W4I9-2]|uniref:sensor histidine kinase n=1 Tax=Streptomyces sp. W4I9-2 TaxID=3042297 RepID=UPI0027843CFB|nr:sensor histidine kinase [Streptomyces sp. W4I9-2]MDQ0696900.1 signal transduction histidine kinase [Streptomyces sp. W4I9-2]